jgi:hypothetical protein
MPIFMQGTSSCSIVVEYQKQKPQREQTMQTKSAKGFSVLAVLILSACGGGGSESATPLSSWTPTSTVIANGLGQEGSYTFDPTTKKISNIIAPPPGVANYSTLLTFDVGVLTGLTLTTPTKSLSFASYEIRNVSTEIIGAANSTSTTLLSDPMSHGWDYQSFGVWKPAWITQGTFGTFSVGAPTAGSAIPGTGNANFTGKVIGSYVSGTGVGNAVLANLTVNVDFSSQSLAFNTTSTLTSLDWKTFTQNDGLNLSGNLSYSPGTNGFTGDLSTVSGLAGQSSGQFYGPAAEELGGVFFLQGNGETYTGAYGAKDITAP